MHSTKALVSSQLLALVSGSLAMKVRGMKMFKLDDVHPQPAFVQSRAYRRSFPERKVEFPPNRRLDETMYVPGRYTEREYQSTWQEPITKEDEEKAAALEAAAKAEEEERRCPCPEPEIPVAVPQRRSDPPRRLQRVAVPAGEYLAKFISDQKKLKKRYHAVEARGYERA